MTLNRRNFLKGTAITAGALVVGVTMTGCGRMPLPHRNAEDLQPSAYLQVTPDGRFILQLAKVEMGQGTLTGMATLVAEELNMPPSMIVVEHARYHPDFADPEFYAMITGGSSSLRTSFEPLREAGAMVSALLKQAAAQLHGIAATEVALIDGVLSSPKGTVPYAEAVSLARTLPRPESLTLRAPSEYRFIGKKMTRLDGEEKVTGAAQYGLDIQYPNTLTAVMVRCPHFGGSLETYDAQAALATKGVSQVLEIDGALAVVAKGYWAARQAANKIKVTWKAGPLEGVDSAALRAERHRLADSEPGKNVEELGSAELARGERFEQRYDVPLLAHATMEPPNALAVRTERGMEIWSGCQSQQFVQGMVADALGISEDQVILHNQLLGGGFGRKIVPDYIVEAAKIAQRSGAPIRLVWSREDDIRHDLYRPCATALMTATIDNGKVTSLQSKAVAPSIFGQFIPLMTQSFMPRWVPDATHSTIGGLAAPSDPSATEGLAKQPYQFDYQRADYVMQKRTAPLGYWRSVGHSQNAFFMESFIDELAHKVKKNPLDFRLGQLDEDSRYAKVLKLVADKADWGNPPAGQYQGIAVHESFRTVVAQVVNVSVEGKTIRVHKVVCAVDCGLAVNPDMVVAQMEGGIVFGLTAALKGEITLKDGAVEQSNFHDYQMLRLPESPDIEVYVLPAQDRPSGVGEPAVPPVAPALANAVFAATGQRLRELPLRLV